MNPEEATKVFAELGAEAAIGHHWGTFNLTNEGSVYGYGGLNWDIPILDSQLYLIPNFMIGAYSQGDGKDLGHALEFRSGLELAYQLPSSHRVGIAFNHISNASLGDKNPGAETLLINYQVPTGTLVNW